MTLDKHQKIFIPKSELLEIIDRAVEDKLHRKCLSTAMVAEYNEADGEYWAVTCSLGEERSGQ